VTAKRSDKILIGETDICQFLGGINRDLFKKLIDLGMPITQFNGRYYAHSENIEEWFRVNTISRGGIEGILEDGNKK